MANVTFKFLKKTNLEIGYCSYYSDDKTDYTLFENEEEANAFKIPSWVIKDVTSDLNYKNGYLARYGIPDSFFEYIKSKNVGGKYTK